MSAVVVNHLHFSVPVDELEADVRTHFPPAFDACQGFQRYFFVKTAEDRATVIIVFDSAESAAAGAARIGPTVFNQFFAPRLASEQEAVVGEALVAHPGP